MTWQAAAFMAEMVAQLFASMVFLAVYLRETGWLPRNVRSMSPVGRHLVYWATATGAVAASWILVLTVRWAWFVYVLLAVEGAVTVLGWWRVVLVWRAQHNGR